MHLSSLKSNTDTVWYYQKNILLLANLPIFDFFKKRRKIKLTCGVHPPSQKKKKNRTKSHNQHKNLKT